MSTNWIDFPLKGEESHAFIKRILSKAQQRKYQIIAFRFLVVLAAGLRFYLHRHEPNDWRILAILLTGAFAVAFADLMLMRLHSRTALRHYQRLVILADIVAITLLYWLT